MNGTTTVKEELQEALKAACWYAKNGDVTNMHPEDFLEMTNKEIVEWYRKAVS